MSAISPPARSRSWQTTLASGVAMLAGLALVLASGSLAWLAMALAITGVLAALCVLGPRALGAIRSNPELLAIAVLIAVAVAWVWIGISRISSFQPVFGYAAPPPTTITHWPLELGRVSLPLLLLTLLTAAGALVLIADAVRIRLGFAPRQRAPWKQLTATTTRPDAIAPRAIAGVLLVAAAVLLGLGIAHGYSSGSTARQAVVLAVCGAAAALIIGVPVVIGSQLRLDRDKAASAREQERQRFAAHLHDSVLQTLALVQRQAHDPAAVGRLARRQEYALRAWMAGETELLSDTLVAALRDAVAGVEDEQGITVELTAIGDRPLDPAGEAMIAAAREALRNAARHAPDAKVFVFAEISDRAAEVFVRDDGPGFDADAIAPERRGIRDAIIGRMAFAGGQAQIESGSGEGTEVALRIGIPRNGR